MFVEDLFRAIAITLYRRIRAMGITSFKLEYFICSLR